MNESEHWTHDYSQKLDKATCGAPARQPFSVVKEIMHAEFDLLNIYDATEMNFGQYQADAYHAGLERSFGLLADFPRMGEYPRTNWRCSFCPFPPGRIHLAMAACRCFQAVNYNSH